MINFRIQRIMLTALLTLAPLGQTTVWAQSDDFRLGLRALEDGHLDAAVIALDAYIKAHPQGSHRAEARFFTAEAYLDAGKFDEARTAYLEFLKENPEHPYRLAAQYRLGKIGMAQDRMEAAADHFSRVNEGPLADEALYILGGIRFRQKKWGETVRTLSSLLRDHPKSRWADQTRYILGMAHFKRGEGDAAVKLLEAYLQSRGRGRKESLWAHAVAGKVYQQRGKCETAKRHFEVVLREDIRFPPRAGAVLALAECYYEKKDFISAAKQYDRYLQDYGESPQSALARIRAGHSHLLAGKHERALKNLQQVKREEVPDDYGQWVMYWTARSQDLSGDQDSALKSYETLTASYPQGVPALNAAAKAAAMRLSRREYKAAIEHLAVLRKSKDHAQTNWALRMTGESQYGLGRYDEAFITFEKVLPEVHDEQIRKNILRKLAISAFRTRRNPQALHYLNRWLEAEGAGSDNGNREWPSRRFEALNFLAIVQTRMGMLNEVTETWRNLEAAVPDGRDEKGRAQKAEFSANRGLVLFRLKEYFSADAQFREWLNRYPAEKNRPEVLLHLGLTALQIGKNSDAVRHLKTFLKENPDHQSAREALYAAALGALRTNDYVTSSELLTKWVGEAGKQTEPKRLQEGWFLLAASRFALADWKGAAKAYHRILNHYPSEKRRKMILGKLETIYDNLTSKDGVEATLRWMDVNASRFDQKEEIFLRLGKKHLALKQGDRASEYFQVVAGSKDPAINGDASFRLARILVDRGEYQEALQLLEEIPEDVFKAADWRAEAEFLRGVAYEARKNWDEAVNAYRAAARQTSSPDIAGEALRRMAKIETVRWKQ